MASVSLRRFFSPIASATLLAVTLIALALPGVAQKDPAKWKARDAWQHPEEVMDALGIKPGSRVADVGCGSGYFTFHLASRVGTEGKVFSEDIDSKVLSEISYRAYKEKQTQIEAVLGTADDPRLPAAALDAILVVDAFHEMKNYDAMLEAMFKALRPGGLLGIIDREAKLDLPRSEYFEKHRIPPALVREDATRNGFIFLREEAGFTPTEGDRKYFFLIFQKP